MTTSAEPVLDKGKAQRPWGLAALLLVVTALIVAGQFFPLREWQTALREQIRELGWLAPVAFTCFYILFAVLLIPPPILSLISASLFGLGWGLLLTLFAANIAALVPFFIARTFLRRRVEAWARGHPRFEALERAIADNGFKVVLLLRLSPMFPYLLINYLLGASRLPLWKFALGTLVGMPPVTAVIVYLGSLPDVAAERDTGRKILLVVGFLATLAAVIMITRYARRALDETMRN
jgi:uncharacterized membrane protein YdjX (TVP38/TMEM64 family)